MRWWVAAAVAAAAFVGLLVLAEETEASHIRGGTLEWKPTGNGNEVEFSGRFFARASFYGAPDVGQSIESSSLSTGAGSTSFEWIVDFVDSDKDWLSATMRSGSGGPRFSYSSPDNNGQPWVVSYTNSARLGGGAAGHMNNNGDAGKGSSNFRLETTVDLTGEEPRSARTLFPAFVPCKKEATCQFTIPSTGDEGRTFRFATGMEATGQADSDATGPIVPGTGIGAAPGTKSFYQPGQTDPNVAHATISPEGVYAWDTRGAALNSGGPTYYSTAIMVEDPHGKVPLDFFIELVDDLPDAPTWVTPPSPCGETQTIEPGIEKTLDVKAISAGSAPIRIDLFGLPPGASFQSSPGNPVTGRFVWTPSESHEDPILVFIATSQAGAQSQPCTVTLNIVRNEPPVPDFSFIDKGYTTGEPVQFTDASSDPDGSITTWNWDMAGVALTAQNPVHSFPTAEDQTVTLTVTDDRGATAAITKTVRVVNRPPVASFNGPSAVDSHTSHAYVEAASDPDSNLAGYRWTVAGSPAGQDPSIAVDFQGAGEVVVCLTAVDDYDAEDTHCRSIQVRNRPPAVSMQITPGTPAGSTGVQYAFRCTASDQDGRVERCEWQFGDGAVAEGRDVVHQFASKKTYTVTVTAVDDGGARTTVSSPVVIDNQAPFARIAFYRESGQASNVVTFVSDSHDVDGQHTVAWTIGGDVKKSGSPVTHAFPDAERIYEIRLHATDDKGATTTAVAFVRPVDLSGQQDQDGDGHLDGDDNCPALANKDQADLDGDGRGDVCDDDRDGDGVLDDQDAFPDDPRVSKDTDGDGIGDGIDDDADGDGVPDAQERVLGTDPLRADSDGDGVEDAEEAARGWNATDPADPPREVRNVVIASTPDGLAVSWGAPTHPGVTGYVIVVDGVEVATVAADGDRVFLLPAGAANVVVQARYGADAVNADPVILEGAPAAVEETAWWPWAAGGAGLAAAVGGFFVWRRMRP